METPGYKSWRATLFTLLLAGLTVFLMTGLGPSASAPIPALSGFLLFFIGALFSYFLPLGVSRYPLLLSFFFLGDFLILHSGGRSPPSTEPLFLGTFLAGYAAWLILLIRNVRSSRLDFERLAAKHILYTQLGGFVLPLFAGAFFLFSFSPSRWDLLAPFLILFPVSYFIGLILGRLRQSQIQIFQTKKRAALGNLLAGLAHEIKNPVTFIYSNIDPLRDTAEHLRSVVKNPDPKTAAMLEDLSLLIDNLQEGAERVKGIVENFRYFSYPGRGKRESVDVNQLLDRSIELLKPKWKDRVEISRQFGELPKIQAEPGEIGQVFVNILDNACDAIRQKGTITVSTRQDGGHVEIRVKDSGQGIPKQILSRIFDPLYTSKPQGQGTGLGLAIAIQIIEDHRGKIEVTSNAGEGTEAVVRLPS